MPMPMISYFQINGLALAVLAVVFSGSWRRSTRYPRDQRLFSTLVMFNAFMLIVDTVCGCSPDIREPLPVFCCGHQPCCIS
jgi:hypothetical protein